MVENQVVSVANFNIFGIFRSGKSGGFEEVQ